jgi:hypothetical protein
MQERFSAIGANRDDHTNLGSSNRERGSRDSRKAALARAAMTAIEPLVDLLLELGITSPEAESLEGGADPSDVPMSLGISHPQKIGSVDRERKLTCRRGLAM